MMQVVVTLIVFGEGWVNAWENKGDQGGSSESPHPLKDCLFCHSEETSLLLLFFRKVNKILSMKTINLIKPSQTYRLLKLEIKLMKIKYATSIEH